MPRPTKPPASPARALARVKLARERLLLEEEAYQAIQRAARRAAHAADRAEMEAVRRAVSPARVAPRPATRLTKAGQAGRVASRIDYQLRRGDFAR